MAALRRVGPATFASLAMGIGVFSCSAGAPPADGSRSPTGGNANAGGSSQAGSGGSGQASGGSSGSASGGSTSSGGSSAGGSTGTGGNGGVGGSTSAGGTGGSASCSDTPPPNGDTCTNAKTYGWCGQDWMNGACAATCGLCSGGSGGSTGSGGSSGGSTGSGGSSGSGGSGGSGGGIDPPPPITSGGQNGWLSRYWDCCKPACGWSAPAGGTPMRSCSLQNQPLSSYDTESACPNPSSDRAFMCWSGAPWAVGDRLAYGFVAASGSNYHCGRCYQLDFTGQGHDDATPQRIAGKTMIVQVINNGGVGGDQLDLLVPGGGVGDFKLACPAQWGQSVDLGAQYGGFRLTCGDNPTCVHDMCADAFGSKTELMAGCEWFLGWFSNVNNPRMVFKQIACPAAITQRSGMPDRG